MNDASNPSRPPFPQPVSGTVTPRFGDIATFMRLPLFRWLEDICMTQLPHRQFGGVDC